VQFVADFSLRKQGFKKKYDTKYDTLNQGKADLLD
jgi:hypothetical protein